eukprot:m.25659 g.25659  ORF g.25659 m.25659 type:complete len:58 (+) comp8745_c0_seq1:3403-3576(+)
MFNAGCVRTLVRLIMKDKSNIDTFGCNKVPCSCLLQFLAQFQASTMIEQHVIAPSAF